MRNPTITIVESKPTVVVTEDGATITAVGIQGPAGPAGGGMSWQGAWNSATSYSTNDGVEYQGSTYIATQANTNDAPPGTSWDLFVSKGATGATGPSGTTAATTAGDLLYHDGNAVTRLGIGSAGQVLTVESGLPAWQNAPAGGGSTRDDSMVPPWISGRWYGLHHTMPFTATTTQAFSDGQLQYTLFHVPVATTIDQVAIEVTAAGPAGAQARLGLYRLVGRDPGALVADFGTVAADTTGAKSIATTATLTPGWYLSAVLFDMPSGTVSVRILNNSTGPIFALGGAGAGGTVAREYGGIVPGVAWGSLPDPGPAISGSNYNAVPIHFVVRVA